MFRQRLTARVLAALETFRQVHTITSTTIALHNQQVLGIAEYGSPKGFPVFYFHGSPGSRLEAKGWHDFARSANARLIGVDRPGIGLSSLPEKDTSLLAWPDRISELADKLNLDRFSVLGCSGGGPYAIACAYGIPNERLKRAGVAAGMGPIEGGFRGAEWQRYLAFQVNRFLPAAWLHWIVDRSFARHTRNPDPLVFEKNVIDKVINNVLSAEDAAYYRDHTTRRDLVDDWRQAFAQGAAGYVTDAKTIFSPWPFQLGDVKGDVLLWYGSKDTFTPLSMGRYMQSRMPRARLIECEGDTHWSIADHGVEILEALVRC
jgi:pimeloyl-ACP methyl ester carboxylesterase